MTWPNNIGEYKLHKSNDDYAFYFYQVGECSFYQALEVYIVPSIFNGSLTIVEVAHLTGNCWGAQCDPTDPLTFNWQRVRNDYYRTTREFVTSSKPMTDRQIESWIERAKRSKKPK